MRKRRVVYLTLPLLLLLFSIFSVIGSTAIDVVNDETPPEAVITFDPQTFSIVVFGVDDVDPDVDVTSIVLEEEHDKITMRYTLTDDAGNYLNLTLELTEKKEHAEVEIVELNYNGEEVIVPEKNRYRVYWQANHPLRHLHQKIHLDDQFKVKTQYNANKNETRIDIEVKGQPKERLVLPGLVIVSLVTDKGKLNHKIEIVDSEPPEIVLVFFERPEYDEPAVIRAYVTDIGTGVDSVTLSYSTDTTGPVNLSMNLVEGFYVAEIPPFPYDTTVRFVISAYDKAGNSAVPWEDSYTVTDSYRAPAISILEQTPTSPNYNESVEIIANVSDNNGSGVDTVILRYSVDSINWINLPMVLTNDLYIAEVQAYPYDTVVLYEVYANDTAGNSAVSRPFFYRVIDSYSPEISDLEHTPALPNYHETVTVSVDVTEPPEASGVSFVILSYWDGSAWTNRTMTLVDTRYTATIPVLPYGTTVRYKMYASDNAGNWRVSDAQFYQVTDNIPPLIGAPPTWEPKEPSAEEQVNVGVLVTEPFGASGVKNVTLWYKATDEWQSVEMVLTNGSWTTIIPGQKADVTVKFYIESYDNAGNRALTLPYSYKSKAPVGWPLAWLAVIILLIVALTITAIYLLYSRRSRKITSRSESRPIVTLYVPMETWF